MICDNQSKDKLHNYTVPVECLPGSNECKHCYKSCIGLQMLHVQKFKEHVDMSCEIKKLCPEEIHNIHNT